MYFKTSFSVVSKLCLAILLAGSTFLNGNAQQFENSKSPDAKSAAAKQTQIELHPQFKIETIATHEKCGPIVCFNFDEFGMMLAGQQDGPLLLIDPKRPAADPERISIYSDAVKNCNGVLPINGHIFVTGVGPKGHGLYRITDSNRDGRPDLVEAILRFNVRQAEYGPHGLALGPEGRIYLAVGRSSRLVRNQNSNIGNAKLRAAHANATLAGQNLENGGTIIRTDLKGEKVEIVATGLRNPRDLAFNWQGELFTHDSDTAAEFGNFGYCPNTLFQVLEGSDFGWRADGAKLPDYFIDCLPSVCDVGRGLPSGIVFYNHWMFPKKYQDSLFVADSMGGKIYSIALRRKVEEYESKPELFMRAKSMQVTDLAIDTDGSLCFSTGGKNSAGGIYKITFTGPKPDLSAMTKTAAARIIMQPQIQTPWARQKLANLKQEMGSAWKSTLLGLALSDQNPSSYRIRALDVMQLFGPVPSEELLGQLATSKDERVRAKTAQMLALRPEQKSEMIRNNLIADSNSFVRRCAAESIHRSKSKTNYRTIRPMLLSENRYEAWAARQLLESLPQKEWIDDVMRTERQRLFLNGATGLMLAYPSTENAIKVLARASEFMNGNINDRNFVDFLRVMQLAVIRGNIDPNSIPAFQERIAEEFPSGNEILNIEISRLLVFLRKPVGTRAIEFLRNSKVSVLNRVHIAVLFTEIPGWKPQERAAIIKFLSSKMGNDRAGENSDFISQAIKKFSTAPADNRIAMQKQKTDASATTNSKAGDPAPSNSKPADPAPTKSISETFANSLNDPESSVAALYRLPKQLSDGQIEMITKLDTELSTHKDEKYKTLKRGLIAVLGRSADEKTMAYLRKIWSRDAVRRGEVAMALATKPDGENWPYIVASIENLEDGFVTDVFAKLLTVNRRPKDSKYYRQVILKGLKLKEKGGEAAVKLLDHWLADSGVDSSQGSSAIVNWQAWYHQTYPDMPKAELPAKSSPIRNAQLSDEDKKKQ